MKKLLTAATVAILTATAAQAADMAARPYAKAPPIAVQVMNWTGFFVGAEGGGAWGRDRMFFPFPLTSTGTYDTSGGIAGGVVGYNWQAPGTNWVFGVEGNFDWARIKGSTACPSIFFTCSTTIDSIFTGTGRLGYAWGPALLYGKGGYAWARGRTDVNFVATGAFSDGSRVNREGYTLGAGLEYMFAPNWSAKIEYDYYHFNTSRVSATSAAGAFVELIDVIGRDVHAVKGGINYHFNWGGPVVAKY